MALAELRGRVAVVTGGGRGLGAALARGLAVAGCHVAVVDLEPAEALAMELRQSGVRATALVADVGNRAAMLALPAKVQAALGPVDLLINNAGVAVAAPVMAMPLADLDWLLACNFLGVAHGCAAFLPLLRERPAAHIVNVCSAFAWLGFPGKAAYAASKAAVRAYSESLRLELAGTRVGVSLLFPGPLDTDLVRAGRAVSTAQQAAEATFLHARAVPMAKVVRACLRGIQHNRARIVVGRDYHLLDWLTRLSPSMALWAAGRMARRLPFARG